MNDASSVIILIKDDEVSGAYLGGMELKHTKWALEFRACHAFRDKGR